jgi:hypothetical protein
MVKGKSHKREILVINQIAAVGLKRFPAEQYAVVKEADDPEAILVRSQDLHKYEFGPSLAALGRAGAGTNNIRWRRSPGAACRCSMRRARTPTR